jgi:hypothetical protein
MQRTSSSADGSPCRSIRPRLPQDRRSPSTSHAVAAAADTCERPPTMTFRTTWRAFRVSLPPERPIAATTDRPEDRTTRTGHRIRDLGDGAGDPGPNAGADPGSRSTGEPAATALSMMKPGVLFPPRSGDEAGVERVQHRTCVNSPSIPPTSPSHEGSWSIRFAERLEVPHRGAYANRADAETRPPRNGGIRRRNKLPPVVHQVRPKQ